MKRTLKSLVVISLLSLFASCEDGMVEEFQETLSKKDLITHTWKVADVKTAGVSILPVVTRLQCITDNILTFNPDGSFIIDEGANVCSPAFAGSGTWSLVENDTVIKWNFTAPENREVFVPIVELSGTTLRISYHFEDVPLPGTYEMVLDRQ
ncbi:MAG: lipocalin family protein [Chitinophagaceae bacterium]|nr:lipocalin family protein [Chitinophagaceae bacterium]MCW5929759.1 lipocalin family protein [Chitinophagaceae bacterium]